MRIVESEAASFTHSVDWLKISSVLFGTCMVHNVISRQAGEGHGYADSAWFQAFIHNFGEVLDRVKLFAILQENE